MHEADTFYLGRLQESGDIFSRERRTPMTPCLAQHATYNDT
jgi:hypothetical protein